MLRYIHTLAAIAFYALGISFFCAYLLLRNDIAPIHSSVWLNTADLPLLLCGMLYGGLSVYDSVRSDAASSRILLIGISLPLIILFATAIILTFWPA